MPSPSAICTVNGQTIATSGTSGVNVAPGSTVTITLSSSAGLNLGSVGGGWSISCTETDGFNPLSTTHLINNTLTVVGYPNFTATFVAPDMDGYAGAAMQWTSTVNAGLANQDSITFGIFVLNSNGTRLFFGPSEGFESNATVGCAADLNAALAIGFGSDNNLAGDVGGLASANVIASIKGVPVSGTATSSANGLALITNSSGEYIQEGVIPVLNVKTYGAKGDGSTDDTAAINSAISAAYALAEGNNTSAVVFFPIGVYMTTGLSLAYETQPGITLRGAITPASESTVFECSVIQLSGAATCLLQVSSHHTQIEDLWFHGNHLATNVIEVGYISGPCISCNMRRCLITHAVSNTGNLLNFITQLEVDQF